MTVVITLREEGDGTRYTALVRHRDEEGRQRHLDMGFHEGWGKAFEQLVEMVRGT